MIKYKIISAIAAAVFAAYCIEVVKLHNRNNAMRKTVAVNATFEKQMEAHRRAFRSVIADMERGDYRGMTMADAQARVDTDMRFYRQMYMTE